MMRRTTIVGIAVSATALWAGACGSDPTPPTAQHGLVMSLVVIAGDVQTVVVAAKPRIDILARDGSGDPVGGARLAVWRHDGPADSTRGETIVTNAAGIAQAYVDVGTRTGTRRFTVRPEAASAPVLEFTAIVIGGRPDFLEPPAPGLYGYGGQIISGPAFRVLDVNRNPISGVRVTFDILAGGGTLRVAEQVSDSTGSAKPDWTLGPSAGTNTIRATVGALSAKVDVGALSGPAAAMVVTKGSNQQAGIGSPVPDAIFVRVTDAEGRGVAGIDVTWSDVPRGATECTGATDSNGSAALPCLWRLGTAVGQYTLNVSAGAARSSVTANALEPPTSVQFASGPRDNATYARGAAPVDTVALEVRVANGAPAVGYAVTFAFSRVALFSVRAVTDARGVASVQWTHPADLGRDSVVGRLDGFPGMQRVLAVNIVGTLNFRSIAAGSAHTCGHALEATWAVYCWGRNTSGQLGDADPRPRLTPTRPAFSIYRLDFMIGVSSSADHSCAISQEFHLISSFDQFAPVTWCWGANDYGQAGAAAGPTVTPTLIAGSESRGYNTGIGAAIAGTTHTCGLDRVGGTGYYSSLAVCWGDNRYGQLGNSSLTNSAKPVAVDSSEMVGPFGRIVAGDGFSCAVAKAGSAWCWGRNDRGQLGDGTTTNRMRPVRVAGSLVVRDVVAGAGHVCAVTTADALYCWGGNDDGQLGDGTTASRTSPVAVAGGISFKSASAGGAHTCALKGDSTAYCWGSNSDGQLGAGTSAPRALTPIAVASALRFLTISSGGRHTCGTRGGSLPGAFLTFFGAYCWGRNDDGQLGDGTTISRSTPVPVADLTPFSEARQSRRP